MKTAVLISHRDSGTKETKVDLHEALTQAKFDRRLIEWHINQGTITKADVEAHMKSLPDCSAQSIPIDITADDYSNGNGLADQ